MVDESPPEPNVVIVAFRRLVSQRPHHELTAEDLSEDWDVMYERPPRVVREWLENWRGHGILLDENEEEND